MSGGHSYEDDKEVLSEHHEAIHDRHELILMTILKYGSDMSRPL
jgi:hypothetical protein